MKTFLLTMVQTVALTVGCGKVESGKDETTGNRFDGKDYLNVSENQPDATDSALSGSGAVVFKSPLGETGSDKNIRLVFSLTEAGALDLVTHAQESLQNGNTIRLQRNGEILQVVLVGKDGQTEARPLKNINATGTITLLVDIHNSESPAHILIWGDGQADPDDDNALFNSDADATTPGRGTGNFWGLSLKQATVTSASLQEALFGH